MFEFERHLLPHCLMLHRKVHSQKMYLSLCFLMASCLYTKKACKSKFSMAFQNGILSLCQTTPIILEWVHSYNFELYSEYVMKTMDK